MLTVESATVALFKGHSEGEWGRLGRSYFHAANALSAEKLKNRSRFVRRAFFLPVRVRIQVGPPTTFLRISWPPPGHHDEKVLAVGVVTMAQRMDNPVAHRVS
jgi:hypothetical protein